MLAYEFSQHMNIIILYYIERESEYQQDLFHFTIESFGIEWNACSSCHAAAKVKNMDAEEPV